MIYDISRSRRSPAVRRSRIRAWTASRSITSQGERLPPHAPALRRAQSAPSLSQPRAQTIRRTRPAARPPLSRAIARLAPVARRCCPASPQARREFHFHAVSVFHFANKVYTVAARSGSSGRASLPFVTPVYAVRASCRRVSPHPTQLNLRWIYLNRHLPKRAQRIRQLHLPRRPALRLKQPRTPHQNQPRHRPRCRHINRSN